MKEVTAAFLSLLLIAAFAWVVAGKRETGASPAPLRAKGSVRVASSADFRPPMEIDPIALGVRIDVTSSSFANQIEALQQAGDFHGLNLLLPTWFHSDPEAVRQWLILQKDLAVFQPALASIACHLSTSGKSELALQWADLLEDPVLRENTLCSILAFGWRQGDFNKETLSFGGIPPERVGGILCGAEGD